jgi:outer membrane protein TolC
MTYNHHEGNIQKTEGNIIKANRDSLFAGGGPSLTVQVSDAVFAPLIARQLASAAGAGFRRANNDTLLAVADAYLNILRARRRLARIDETLDYLTSSAVSPMRAGSKGLLPLVKDFVDVGRREALRSDLARVDVEVLRRHEERRAALQEFAVAQAELARLLALDPRTPLWPGEDFRAPMPMPVGEWVGQPVEALVAIALRSRPELAESQALVQAAVERVRQAQTRPILPNLSLGYNFGGFGGGPDLNPPIITPPAKPGGAPKVTSQPGFGPSGRIEHFNNRSDLDASVYWRLQNFGMGDFADIRQQQAAERRERLRLAQVQDRVAAQVVQAVEQIGGWRQRLDVTRSALFDARGRPTGPVFQSLQLNFDRIRAAEGRPLEVLDSIRSLSDALEAYGQAVTEYERAQFRLLIAVGLPPRAILSLFPQAQAGPPADVPTGKP